MKYAKQLTLTLDYPIDQLIKYLIEKYSPYPSEKRYLFVSINIFA